MTEEDLIRRIKLRANDPRSQNSMLANSAAKGRLLSDVGLNLCPVATLESLREAEMPMGFALPPLLRCLYLEVGNGGFGPGYGLYGVSGGFEDDQQGMTLPDLYLSDADYDAWPKKLVSICDWGCTMGSAIDCSSLDGRMFFVGGRGGMFRAEGITFVQWMEDWVDGVDLFSRAYNRGSA
jgi:hypothetical protein